MEIKASSEQKITPFLWFNDNAEEALHFYTSIFPDSKITGVSRQSPDGPLFTGTMLLHGQEFMVLNGGPHYQFTPAVSFFVKCESQAEVDDLWEKLSVGGQPQRCGWLTDKFGVSWQIIPSVLGQLLHSKDAERSGRAMQAMLQMVKIDIATLQAAYDGTVTA